MECSAILNCAGGSAGHSLQRAAAMSDWKGLGAELAFVLN